MGDDSLGEEDLLLVAKYQVELLIYLKLIDAEFGAGWELNREGFERASQIIKRKEGLGPMTMLLGLARLYDGDMEKVVYVIQRSTELPRQIQ